MPNRATAQFIREDRMRIKRLHKDDLEQIRPLLERYSFKPYSWFSGMNKECLCDNLIFEIQTLLEDKRNRLLAAYDRTGRLQGMASIQWLDWDTGHFDVPMGLIPHFIVPSERGEGWVQVERILLTLFQAIEEEAREIGIKHLTIKPHTGEIFVAQAAIRHDYELMDSRCCYGADLVAKPPPPVPNPNLFIRKADEKDLPELIELTRNAFFLNTDRFHNDPALSRDRATDLYIKWIKNSFTVLGRDIWVAEIEDYIAGYMTAKRHSTKDPILNRRVGELELACVSPRARKQQVYRTLFVKALQEIRADYGIEIVQEITQMDNFYVQWAWLPLGFKPVAYFYALRKVFR